MSEEVGQAVPTCGYHTNVIEMGSGAPLVLLHGSGPGVSAWANWRGVAPTFAEHFRVLMPDLVGFGYTDEPADYEFTFMDSWVSQIEALLAATVDEPVTLVGNSFGGAVALAFTIAHPKRVKRLVLMGSVGTQGTLSDGLDQVWGYTPSLENMRGVLDVMAWNRDLVTDDLAQMRYQASLREGVQERFARLFPEPRQRWLDAIARPDESIAAIQQPTLLLHGRDDRVIPLAFSERLHQLIPNSQLHSFGQCGHWTQIEQAQRFIALVTHFAQEAL